MLRFLSTIKLPNRDRQFIRIFGQFVLDKYITKQRQNNTQISVSIKSKEEMDEMSDFEDLKTFNAWCTDNGFMNGKRYISIVIDSNQIKSYNKTLFARYSNFLLCLGHELIHCKQFVNGEMRDYVNGNTRFKDQVFSFDAKDAVEERIQYYDSPWEKEAYGSERGLYVIFKKLWYNGLRKPEQYSKYFINNRDLK